MAGVEYGSRVGSVGQQELVPGMPTEHPTSIEEARSRPGSPPRPRERKTVFSTNFEAEQDQLQNPADLLGDAGRSSPPPGAAGPPSRWPGVADFPRH